MQDVKKISDEELVEKVRNEDKELYIEIVNRYEEKLMRYTTYLISNSDKASDVVQDSFIKAYVNLNGFNTKKKFSSWIYRIAHNEAMNAVKKYHKEYPIDKDMDFASGVDLEDEFNKKQIQEMAQKCLNDIPIKYSEPLMLHFIEDYSYEDISDILRLPMGTVATRINRAKALMKNIKKNVMEQITENKISMRPKSFFVLGSIFTFTGLIASVISSIFLISLISFLLKEHGPMGQYRLSLMIDSFPLWLPILAVVGLVFGVWFLLKYDFSYKTNYVFIIFGFIIAIVVASWVINITGFDNLWLNHGPMRRMMRQYIKDNNIKPGSGFRSGNQFHQGQMMNNDTDY